MKSLASDEISANASVSNVHLPSRTRIRVSRDDDSQKNGDKPLSLQQTRVNVINDDENTTGFEEMRFNYSRVSSASLVC